MDIAAMNTALSALCAKYGVSASGTLEAATDAGVTGVAAQLRMKSSVVPLLPWRVTRRFMELKTLAAGPTLEGVSTLRFMYAAGNLNLPALLYRELDLCEWIGGSPLISLFTVASGQAASNTIARLASGISCSLECSCKLPATASPVDRHEVIASRGVASDRVVDTQVPQSSIYVYGEGIPSAFTDEDAELFGMDAEDVFIVRAAFAALKDRSLASAWIAQHTRLCALVKAAVESATTRQPQALKEVSA